MEIYLQIFNRRKWVIIVTALVTCTVVTIGTFLMPPTYSATALVRVAQVPIGSIERMDYRYAESLMNTYVQILRSRPILEEVIQRLGLSMMPKDLSGEIKVEALVGTELIRINVEDGNPQRAAAIANTLTALLIEQSQSLYSGGGKSAREILQDQLEVIASNLQQDRAQLQRLTNMNPTAGAQEQIDALNNKIAIQEETYATLLARYEQARVEEAVRANSITTIEPAIEPEAPSGPRKSLNIILGALVGLAGGTGLAFLFENLDTTLRVQPPFPMPKRGPVE